MTETTNPSQAGPLGVVTTSVPVTGVPEQKAPAPVAPAAPVAGAEPGAPIVAPTAPATPEAPVTPPSISPAEPVPAAPLAAEAGEATGELVYAPTGDPGMDMALTFVGKLGLAPDHPAMLKAGEGDFSFLKAHLASLGDTAKGWEQHVALAERSYGDAVKSAEANTAAINKAVHDAAGGADAWAGLSKWAGEVATPEQKVAVNKALNADPETAALVVLGLQALYNQAPGTTVVPKNAGAAAAGGVPADTNSPLSRKEYVDALAKLARDKGTQYINDRGPEYLALQQRAARYRA